jgi:hypothetical protein
MLLLLLPTALASETWDLTYTVTLADAPVGQRVLTVTYLPGPHGEQRLLECYTDAPGVKQRVSGTPEGAFAALNQQGGAHWEVQSAAVPTGWMVSYADSAGLQQDTLRLGAFDATSLSLMDPGQVLEPDPSFRVLSAETGEVLTGPLTQVGPTQVQVGDTLVDGTEYSWASPTGAIRVVTDPTGLVLSTSTQLAGQTLEMTLDALPPERTWDTLDAPLIDQSAAEEQEL